MSGPKARPFESLVNYGDVCWEWRGSLFSNGYGRAIVGRKSVGAHRRSWEMAYGQIPDGMLVCHRCDNRRCVRPSHLFLGSPADNMRDMVTKGRSMVGSRNHNAKLTEATVREIVARYADGGITQKQLAAEYGVVEGAIWNVLHGRSWEVAA